VAMQGLLQYGDHLFRDIRALPPADVEARTPDLVKISGKVKGLYSVNFLLEQLNRTEGHDDRIIHSLWVKGFEAELPKNIHQFNALLTYYQKTGMEKVYQYNEVPNFNGQALVKNCLLSEVKSDLATSLKICVILYHKKEINRVMELVERSKTHKLFNAMEMLEWVLPKAVAFQVNSLIDFVLDPTTVRRPFIEYDVKAFFHRILVTRASMYSEWTRALCIYCLLQNDGQDLVRELGDDHVPGEHSIIRETKAYVLQYNTAV
ncbi:MAG TPA: hypothetical protein VGE66_03215, partial [Chitinophagaceae bacterium]